MSDEETGGTIADGDRCDRDKMYATFQSWALQNYGDSGKTKTLTVRKYERVVNILTGDESMSADNSKFRFWVKAKGFRLGVPTDPADGPRDGRRVLYVPYKNSGCVNGREVSYKQVAVVENFFDIIYNVHVEMDVRGGKHAGQKRTYRAIAETYSFLPREAVTRFLMSCADCQKRMHLSLETGEDSELPAYPADSAETAYHADSDLTVYNADSEVTPYHGRDSEVAYSGFDLTMPITTAYMNLMRHKSAESPSADSRLCPRDDCNTPEGNMSSGASQDGGGGGEQTPSSATDAPAAGSPGAGDSTPETTLKNSGESAFPVAMITETSEATEAPPTVAAGENGDTATCCKTPTHTVLTPPSGRSDDRGHPERKRRASNDSADSSTKTSECYADDTGKDDDDDNEDDDDDKLLVGHDKDPERLKAFNMFVRLFVDENLDRMVPISKQPKDKIQAILEACDRQFPEFHERSRKRIRTYLKSCRRMRRSKETTNGWEPLRPTPPHLTSAAAESILAHACENESSNAKRMRMGLDPLPAKAMSPTSMTLVADSPAPQTPQKAPVRQPSPAAPQPPAPPTAGSPPTPPRTLDVQLSVVRSDYLHHAPPLAPTAFRPPPHDIPPPPPPSTFFTNGNGFFRPGFPATYQQHPAHHHPPVIQHTPLTNQLGPTDLSMKKCSSPTSLSKSQLNPSEVTTIKQLIAGYRESAAFLYRSADELEQLLLHHN